MLNLIRSTKINKLQQLNLIKNIKNFYGSLSQKQQNGSSANLQFQNVNLKTFDDIPGPKAYPIVGSFFSMKREGLSFLSFEDLCGKLYAKYGDIVKLKLPDMTQIFLFDPEYVKKVFQVDGESPIRPEIKPFKLYFDSRGIPSTLVNSSGQQWRKLRSASNPIAARPKNVQLFLSKQNKIGNEFVNLIEEKIGINKSITFNEYQENLKLLTLELISVVAFDKELNCIDERKRTPNITKVVKAADDFLVLSAHLLFNELLWRIYRTKNWKKLEAAGDILFTTVREYVKEAYDNIKKKDDEFKQDITTKTILQQYILSMDKYNLTIDDVIALTTDFLIGGIDTTSTVIHFILYELGKNPDIQKILYEEIKANCKDNDDLSEDKLEKMQFLKAVVKETLRLHPVAPQTSRILKEDIVLKDYLIPKGTTVCTTGRWMSTSERYYKNALEFKPRRWLKDDEAFDKNVHPYSNIPFGFGARMCIGRRIAEQEIYLMITKIINRFHVDYLGETIGHQIKLIASPDKPLIIKFTKRD